MRNFLLLFLLGICGIFTGNAADLVKPGQPSALVVIPADAIAVEEFAAQEVVDHIFMATGVKLTVVRGAAPAGKNHLIRLGRAAKVERNWSTAGAGTVKISADAVDIAGIDGTGTPENLSNPSGTLLALYNFLNNELGVAHLWPGKNGTFVPKRKEITLKETTRQITPKLKAAYWRNSVKTEGWNNPKNCQKFHDDIQLWFRRQGFIVYQRLNYGHAFTDYFDKYSAKNPELFNLLPNGRRISDPLYYGGAAKLVSMCVSNPELVKLIVENWQRSGTHNFVNVNENDTAGKCVCANCMAMDNNPDPNRLARVKAAYAKGDKLWYNQLGSLTDRYAKFYLAVQKEADKIKPGCMMSALIYGNYFEPPSFKLNDRILMRFCPPVMYPWTTQKVNDYKRIWQGWYDAGVKLGFRPNFTHDGHNFPLIYYPEFDDCYRFAAERSLYYVDLDSLTGMFGANGLTLYVIARRVNGDTRKLAELENDYFAAFGPAEKTMRQFVEIMRIATAGGDKNGNFDKVQESLEGGNFSSFFVHAHKIFTPAVMNEGISLLDKAMKECANDPEALARVDFVRTALLDAQLVLETQKAFAAYPAPGSAEKFVASCKKLQAFRAANEHKGYANLAVSAGRENARWPMHMLNTNESDVVLSNWQIFFDEKKTGDAQEIWKTGADASWPAIGTDSHWEKQPAGIAWEKAHGKPYKGVAWYSVKFDADAQMLNKKTRLYFGAVDGQMSIIYFNGQKLLERPFPYQGDMNSWRTPFSVSIPAGLLKAKENLLVVRVEKYTHVSGIWHPVFFGEEIEKSQTSATLIPNGDFAGAALAPWRVDVPSGHFKFTVENNKEAKNGRVLKISCPTPDAKGAEKIWGRAYQPVKVVKGEKYKIKVRFKTLPGFQGGFEFWVRSGNGKDANRTLKALGKEGWQEMSGILVPGSNEAIFYLTIRGGIGTVLVDEVILESTAKPKKNSTATLIPNGTFDEATLAPWKKDVPAGHFKFSVEENSEAKNGQVLKISCPYPDAKGAEKIWGRTYQPVKVVKGKRYRAKVRFKTLPGFQGRFEFWIRSGNGKDANRTLSAGYKDQWQEMSGILVPGSNEAVFYLTIRGGTGTVLVDEVILE